MIMIPKGACLINGMECLLHDFPTPTLSCITADERRSQQLYRLNRLKSKLINIRIELPVLKLVFIIDFL